MKYFALVVLFTFMMAASVSAKADEFAWTGTEILTPVSGEFAFNDQIGLRGHLTGFFKPAAKVVMAFAYVGPTFTPVSNEKFGLWISPQLAIPFGWYEGEDAMGPSVWVNLSFFGGKLAVFLEGEVYVSFQNQLVNYYGYYAVDGCPGAVNAGIQVEQVDAGVIFGPHIGGTIGPLHLEAQYYLGFQDANRGHTIRLVTGLSF